MTARRTALRFLATALAAVLLVLPVFPAFADDVPPAVVLADVTIGGQHLQNLTAEEASAAIAAAVPTSSVLPAVAKGHTYLLETSSFLVPDISGLVADAIAATGTLELTPRYVMDLSAGTYTRAFVKRIASKIDRKAVNAKRVITKRRRLKVKASVRGANVDEATSRTLVLAALVAKAAGAQPATVTIPVASVKAKVTRANIGKTIIVSLGEFKVRLYKHTKLEKTYRCAIGMPGHRTPRGKWKVIAKSAAPTWRNPGSAWARGMPAVIPPGYYNPLGLRALYLNASGIRIHGTSKTYSMGQAASHGCIRLTNHNVVDIFPRVKVGTPVYIVR